MIAGRRAQSLARWVLAWIVLSLGQAMASSHVDPLALQQVCTSAGIVEVVTFDDQGAAGAHSSPSGADCPLCNVPPQTPPAMRLSRPAQPLGAFAYPVAGTAAVAWITAPPLPSRGPPVVRD